MHARHLRRLGRSHATPARAGHRAPEPRRRDLARLRDRRHRPNALHRRGVSPAPRGAAPASSRRRPRGGRETSRRSSDTWRAISATRTSTGTSAARSTRSRASARARATGSSISRRPPTPTSRSSRGLGEAELTRVANGWVRAVVEKPFGHDLATCRHLNEVLRQVFPEKQVYRIDHYLGKETVQNIFVLRFANGIFEPIWNHRYVDHVQISVAESVGVGHRAGFYEEAGRRCATCSRTTCMQLLTLTAMEPPAAFEADAIRAEKVKVLESIRPFENDGIAEWAVRGQYGPGVVDGKRVPGYREEEKVDPQIRDADLRRDQGGDRQLALGGRAVLPAFRQAAGQAGDRGRDRVQAGAAPLLQQGLGRALAERAAPAHPAGRGRVAEVRRQGPGLGAAGPVGVHGLPVLEARRADRRRIRAAARSTSRTATRRSSSAATRPSTPGRC